MTRRERMDAERRSRRWGWYSLVYELAGGDFMRMGEVAERPAIECFDFLGYRRSTQKLN